jgi:hypothetical protein
MSRLAGKTAGETIAMMMAAFRRLDPLMRGSVTFDNDTCFARHMLLRGLLSATTYFCDAYASWQKGGVENANGRIRRWLPRSADLDAVSEQDIQEIAMTINLTPRKCLGYKSPLEAFPCHLSVSPCGPERWQIGAGLEDGLQASDTALEEGSQAAPCLAGAILWGFFSAGVGLCSASHMPVETAQ